MPASFRRTGISLPPEWRVTRGARWLSLPRWRGLRGALIVFLAHQEGPGSGGEGVRAAPPRAPFSLHRPHPSGGLVESARRTRGGSHCHFPKCPCSLSASKRILILRHTGLWAQLCVPGCGPRSPVRPVGLAERSAVGGWPEVCALRAPRHPTMASLVPSPVALTEVKFTEQTVKNFEMAPA